MGHILIEAQRYVCCNQEHKHKQFYAELSSVIYEAVAGY